MSQAIYSSTFTLIAYFTSMTLVVLKLCGVVSLSWPLVLFPLWGPFALAFILALIIALVSRS